MIDINKLRLERGESVAVFAEKAKLTVSYAYYILNTQPNKLNPRKDTLLKLSKWSGLTIDEIVKGKK